MTTALAWTLGALLTVIGVIGCFVPVVPGPLVAYAALWLPLAFGRAVAWPTVVEGGIVVVAVTVVDYVLPSVCARRFNCSGWGVFGCLAGSVVGLFFLPLGIIVGPFLGTVAGELVAGKNLAASLRGGFGSLLGYVLCLVLKLCAVAWFAWQYFRMVSGWAA